MGFLTGSLSLAYLFWTFWTFTNNPSSTSSSDSAPVASRYSSLAGYLMQQPATHGDEVLELSCALRGLFITVRGPSSQVVDFVRFVSDTYNPATAQLSSAPSSHSFDLVSELPASPRSSVPAGGSVGSSAAETRAQIESTFIPAPAEQLQFASRLVGSSISGIDRVKRAWLAGQWAAAVAAGRVPTPNRSSQLDLRSRFYSILRAPGLSGTVICKSATTYFRIVGRIQDNDSISHAFPSEIEAKIFFAGASAPSFETRL